MRPEIHEFLGRHVPGYDRERWSLELAATAGSQRQFWRVSDGRGALILMVWTSQDPDWPRCLGIHEAVIDQVGLIPRVLASDAALGLILEEDLGGRTLRRCWDSGEPMGQLYGATLEAQGSWQRVAWQGHPVLSRRVMDEAHLAWESEYFSEHCVGGLCGLGQLLTPAWESERLALAARVDKMPKVWMHRDFQSENVLWCRGRVRFVDWQGARLGPAAYDVASLLHDPYVPELDGAFIEPLRAAWLAAAPVAVSEQDYLACAAQRLMQAMGAYGKLSRVDGLTRYVAFAPLALSRLRWVTERLEGMPRLREIVVECEATAGNLGASALSDTSSALPTTASRETAT